MTKRTTIIAGLLLSVAACAQIPQPLCDREAQEWNKFDTAEDQCAVTATERAPTAPRVIKRHTPSPNPEPPVSGPENEPEPDTTEEDGATKPKSDNSDANGKGGNKHDREDKTDHGTETAEEKKDG